MKWSTWNIPHLGYFSLFSACGVALGWWELVRRHTFVLVCLSKGVPANAVVVTNSTPCWYTTTKDGLWIVGEWWAIAPAICFPSQCESQSCSTKLSNKRFHFWFLQDGSFNMQPSKAFNVGITSLDYIELRYLVIDTPTHYVFMF